MESLGRGGGDRLVARVSRWASSLDLRTYHARLSVCAAEDFASCFPLATALPNAVLASVRAGLARSDRLAGRPLLGVWGELAGLAFSPAGRQSLLVPPAWGTAR